MRISTGMMQSLGAAGIQRNQTELYKLQQQLASGRRILSPADDPVGQARAMSIADAKARNERFAQSQETAAGTLALAESTVGAIGDTMQTARELLIQAGSGSLSEADRRGVAVALREQLGALLGLANARDEAGAYLFSGVSAQTMPFSATATGATYNGDQGNRTVQVSSSRTIAISINGQELFESVRRGNGVFVTAAAAANTGTASIDTGVVTGTAAGDGTAYALRFAVTAGITTYDVLDTTNGTTVSSGNAFQSGTTITIAGRAVAISGAPADGDEFTVVPAVNQSVFATLTKAIASLESGSQGLGDSVRRSGEIGSALADLDQALDRVLAVRGTMGANLRELEALGATTSEIDIQYASDLSAVRDIDYVRAITDFSARQTALEAAQSSYSRMMARTLFDFL